MALVLTTPEDAPLLADRRLVAVCEVHERRWRDALRPMRVVLTLAAVGCFVAALRFLSLFGLGLIGFGAALLLAAVVLPTIRQVEFGLPVGVKVVTAVREREEELRSAFESCRGDLQLYARLLVGDPDVAAEVLEAAWSRTAAVWRGPVTPDLHEYVICVLVQLVEARGHWVKAAGAPAAVQPLAAMPLQLRTAVVLHEFAQLTIAQIAAMTGRPADSVRADLRTAEALLAADLSPGDIA